jgi:CBS domain-containing protein
MKTIKQLMSSPVVMATGETTVKEVRELMSQHEIGALPITTTTGNHAEIKGIVTAGDLRDVKDANLPIMDVMSTKLCYVNKEDSTAAAASLMLKNSTQHLLVKEQEEVIGILSSADLLKWVASRPVSHQPHLYFI